MSELRRDPVSGRWVIISPERANRPLPPSQPEPPSQREGCPFCPGNEKETPPEIRAIRPSDSPANGPGWHIRVVPNRYPALIEGPSRGADGKGLFRRREGVGAHEVIIESPDHKRSLTELTDDEVAGALRIYCERIGAHRRRGELSYALLFKNVGPEAGASIEHTHAQLIATPVLPSVIDQEARLARRQWREHRRCVFCEMIRLEASEGQRIVLATESFVALCPFASRFPMEVWILPTSHAPDFDSLPSDLARPLAAFLRAVLNRLERETGRPRYNILFHTAPFRRREDDSYHWHIEVMPRLGHEAGFEWGSGMHCNPISPETSAARLRSDGERRDLGGPSQR